MANTTVKWLLPALSILVLTACGGGSGGGGDQTEPVQRDFISITGPDGGGHVSQYETLKPWVESSGYAEVPDAADCTDGDVFLAPPEDYRVTVTNVTNGYEIEAVAGIVCLGLFSALTWDTYFPIPLELGENKLIARVSYPPEGISGQITQTVTRNSSQGPMVEKTLPEDQVPGSQLNWIPSNTPVSVIFGSEIDPNSIDADSFLVRDQNSVPVTGQIEVEDFEVDYLVFGDPVPHPDWNYSKVTFTPDFPLPPLATISVTISGSIKDITGREMGDDYEWSFRTGPY